MNYDIDLKIIGENDLIQAKKNIEFLEKQSNQAIEDRDESKKQCSIRDQTILNRLFFIFLLYFLINFIKFD